MPSDLHAGPQAEVLVTASLEPDDGPLRMGFQINAG